jgi:hypothetical protein
MRSEEAKQLVEEIRGEKLDKDSPDLRAALKLLAEELNTKETHFILELLQNAEDHHARGHQMCTARAMFGGTNNDHAVDLLPKNRRIAPLWQHQPSAKSKASLRACRPKLNSPFWNASCIAPV